MLFHVDITARKLLADHLAGLAEGDMLTGLPNRRAAVRFIDEQLTAARTTGRALSVLFLDLDGFKAVNDRFGHHVGDELLVKVAALPAGPCETRTGSVDSAAMSSCSCVRDSIARKHGAGGPAPRGDG